MPLNRSTENIKLLYVEDDEIARENAVEYLENYFDSIYEASNAIDALKLYKEHKPQIIISDISMPKLNGLEFVKEIRKTDKKTQIILVTAFCTKEYLLEAIELGLVKYLVKPVEENSLKDALNLCLEAICEDNSNLIEISKDIIFDSFNKNLKIDDELIKLRAKEILFLELLIKNKNRVVSYEEIESYVWHDSVMTKDALKTLIKNIKSKLPKDIIENLASVGYKIAV